MSEGFNVGNNINNVSNIIGMNIFLDPSQPDFQSINVPQELPWMRAGMEGERKINRRF